MTSSTKGRAKELYSYTDTMHGQEVKVRRFESVKPVDIDEMVPVREYSTEINLTPTPYVSKKDLVQILEELDSGKETKH